MQTVYKYPLAMTATQHVPMPAGATILTAQIQAGRPCVWALVNPDAPTKPRRVILVGTGNIIPDGALEGMRYVATVQQSLYVWHIWAD